MGGSSLAMTTTPPIKKLWVGIDPGVQGAVGVIDSSGRFVECWDLPVIGKAGRKQEFNVPLLCQRIKRISQWRVERVDLEWPTTRPGEAPESSKRFGVGLGLLWGIFEAHGLRVRKVAPNKWKGKLGLIGKAGQEHAAKMQAVEMAERFISDVPSDILRGPRGGLEDGRAESLMIAWEALTCTVTGLREQPKDIRIARMLFGPNRRRVKGKDTL